MNQASSEGEMIKKKDVLLTKDRAYYIVYLITIIFPLVVGFCFYDFAVRARLHLGHWPKYGEDGGPSLPGILGILDFLAAMITLFGIPASVICIPASIVMTIPYAFKKSIFSRKKLAIFIVLIVISTVAITGIATDFGGLWSWFID